MRLAPVDDKVLDAVCSLTVRARRRAMAMRLLVGLVALTYLGVLADAQAQTLGDSRAGLRIVRAQCAECHRIANERGSLRNAAAPSFKQVADTPGMTSTALTAALRTSHRTMPNVIIPNAEIRDVVAYILSLRRER